MNSSRPEGSAAGNTQKGRKRAYQLRAVCFGLASAVAISLAPATHATTYNEAVSGDLSNNPAIPTSIGILTLGANTVMGSTIPSGVFNPVTHAFTVVDADYFTFVVPLNEALVAINIDSSTSIQTGDRMFFGIASGGGVSVDPSFSSAAGLLGWTLVGLPDVGTDVLPALGLSAPANFPPIPGATGFSGPLPSGTYTIWLQDGDGPATYKLNLAVAGVPEPATWSMLLVGFGGLGGAMRLRRRRHVTVFA